MQTLKSVYYTHLRAADRRFSACAQLRCGRVFACQALAGALRSIGMVRFDWQKEGTP